MTEIPEISVGELRKSGVVKLKGDDMYSVWIKTACCNLNSTQLEKLADITDKYARGYLLFTTRQIPIIPFVSLENVGRIKEELAPVYLELDRCGPTVRNINVCYDDKICLEAVTNSISLAEKLDNFFRVPSANHKVKIGVAGCQKDCIISRALNDLSFIAGESNDRLGYDIYLGGRLGVNPFLGVKMAECLPEEECVRFTQNYFDFITTEGRNGERGADLISRLGVAKMKQELNNHLQVESDLKPIICETRLEKKETDKVILRIRATCGEVTSNQLRKIAAIAEDYGHGFVHFAVRGSPEIPGIDPARLESIGKEYQAAGLQMLGKGLDNLQSCFGDYCTESNVDPQSLLKNIEKKVEELDFNNPEIKISATGCPNSCGIAQLNDIGFMGIIKPEIDTAKCNGCALCLPVCKRKALEIKDGIAIINKEKCVYCGQCIVICPFDAIIEKKRGFAVFVGGKEGKDTRLGQMVTEFLSEEAALQITERCLEIVKDRRANVAAIIDEVGIEIFSELLIPSTR